MQIFRSAVVHLPTWTLSLHILGVLLSPQPIFAASTKVHVVALGVARKALYTPPESANPGRKSPDSIPLKIRPLLVDGHQKEWTTGEAHDVTDRSFTIRRALHLNDTLPSETVMRWSWQPGPWLLVDRVTGRITALHLPNFDAEVSDVVWFRDYAAYCGVGATAKGGLFAMVAQLGARRAVVQKSIGKWPQADSVEPVCKPALWQRSPIRVTLQPLAAAPLTFDVVGAASLIEENDSSDDEN